MNLIRVLLMLTVAVNSWGFVGGGDLVNNGGGVAEKNVYYAYENMQRYLQLCLASSTCKLTNDQQALVRRIQASLPQERNGSQLIFASEKKAPGTFMIDGQVRVAKTGSRIGSPIYINVDLLYSKTTDGYEAMTIPEAVAVLVHEFGHHQGNFPHIELDIIGVRISQLIQQKTINTPLLPWSSFISASVLMSTALEDYPQLLLTVGDDVIDLSAEYKKSVYCEVFTIPIPIVPLPDLELVTKEPMGSILHNIHWDKVKQSENELVVKIVGNVSNVCLHKNNLELRNNNYLMSIKFKVNKVQGSWKYDPNTLELDQFRDPWWKLIRLPN